MTRVLLTLLVGIVVSLGAMVAGGGEAWATELKCDFISGSGNYGGKWDSGYFHYDTTAKTIEVWRPQLFYTQKAKLKLNKYGGASLANKRGVLHFKCDKVRAFSANAKPTKGQKNQIKKNAANDVSSLSNTDLCVKASRYVKALKSWVLIKTYGVTVTPKILAARMAQSELRERGVFCSGKGDVPTAQAMSDMRILNLACYKNRWSNSSSMSSSVKIAKRRGLSCDVRKMSEPVLCNFALNLKKSGWSTRQKYMDFVQEAKRRGLSCGVGSASSTIQTASAPKTKSKATSAGSSFATSVSNYTDDEVCMIATSNGNWANAPQKISSLDAETGFYDKYIEEAKRRGLSCGVGEASSSTQTASAPKVEPEVTSAALTASQKEADRLRQELAALRAKQQQQKQNISSDTKLPTITIASANTKSKQGIIRGRVNDNTGVAEVTVGGKSVPFDASGNFKFETFVPVGGKQVVIQVTDLNGLSNSKTVKLNRSASNTTTAITFDSLNPLGRKVAKNKDALALIIGIEKYKNTVDAAYADKDALMFRDYATEKLGIPSNRIKTLINNEADISGMLLGVRKWLRRSSKPNESDVYVFYAGHGITTPDREAYLFPYDGVTEVLDRTALLQKDLFSEIEKANPRNVTIFLDACYTGKARTGEVLMADAELRPIAIRPIDDGLPDNFTLLTASSGSEFSGPLKEVKQGMFSYYLMKGMEGVADTNQDNKITAGELHAYVKTNVLQQSSDSQTPQLQGDENRVLVQFQ